MEGYIKLHRKILENPVICKDSDYFAVWTYLLLNATHTKFDVIFKNERVTLQPGQLVTGRKVISDKFNISESKVQRIIKKLESEHQIEQQTCSQNRLITILNWDIYQSSEQQNEHQVNNERTTSEHQVNNERTTSEQRVNTNKNVKNVKNVKECSNNVNNVNNVKKEKSSRFTPPSLPEVQDYCFTRNNNVNAEAFIDFYESKGWMVGKNKMKDWKACVRTWEKRDNSKATSKPNKQNNMMDAIAAFAQGEQ